LFDKVCEHLNILEKDYFGMTYIDPAGEKVRVRILNQMVLLFVNSKDNCKIWISSDSVSQKPGYVNLPPSNN